MAWLDIQALSLVALAATATVIVVSLKYSVRRDTLPPGPPMGFWGYCAPASHPWRQWKEWTEQYGDIFTLRLGPRKRLFVLGTARSAHQILEKQSAVSSDRPRQIMASELISGGKRILLIPYGDKWRKYRRALHEALQDRAAKSYEPIQEKEARIAAFNIGENPDSFQTHFHRYAASVIMTVTYDHVVQSLDDPLLRLIRERIRGLLMWVRPGASPLDRIPLLEYLPTVINKWKKEGNRLHALELGLFRSIYLDVRQRFSNGDAKDCFSSNLQERQKELGLSDEEASYIAGSMFGAGSDTTSSALSVFVMAMCRFPAVSEKAQEELDRVIGSDRLPTFNDFELLPYVRAVVQETLRWRPISPGGFLHALTEDVVFDGYVLPKGSAVVGPHWSISLDPKEYPDPDEFKPERFLDEDGNVKGTWFAPSRGSVAFGFGRRICVGLAVAERSLFINLAILLWAFDFASPTGNPLDIDTLAFDSAANSHPLPFKAKITYRSDKHQRIVEDETAEFL